MFSGSIYTEQTKGAKIHYGAIKLPPAANLFVYWANGGLPMVLIGKCAIKIFWQNW